MSLAVLLAGCTSTLDVDRARRWLETPEAPGLPELRTSATADLSSPEGLDVASGGLRRLALRWDPLLAGDVAGYAVERAPRAEGPFTAIGAVAGRTNTVWVDEGPSRWPGAEGRGRKLGDGETLFYRVRAFTSDGELAEATSEVGSGTTAPPPDPPAGLRAYSQQPREVPLSWQPSGDAHVVGYILERSPTSRGPFELLEEIRGREQTVFVDRGLGDLRVFYYRVASVNAAGGRGKPSEPVRAVTKPEPLPPLGLAVAARRLGANELVWEANVEPDLAGYRVLRERVNGDSNVVVTLDREQTRAIDFDVASDERVSYSVVALDEDGLESDAAQPIEAQSVGYELSASSQPDGVHLAWNGRPEEGYRGARVFLHGLLRQVELGFVEGSEFVHRDAQPGRRYRYTVVLVTGDASSAPPSSPVEIEVPES